MADDLARTYFGTIGRRGSTTSWSPPGRRRRSRRPRRATACRRCRSRHRGDARDALQHSIGLVLAVAVICGAHRHARGRKHLAGQRPPGDSRARPAPRGRSGQPSGDAPGPHRGGSARRSGDPDRCRRGLHHGAADAPREHRRPSLSPVSFPLETVVVLDRVVVLGAVVATIGPARRAVRTSVLSALRHE